MKWKQLGVSLGLRPTRAKAKGRIALTTAAVLAIGWAGAVTYGSERTIPAYRLASSDSIVYKLQYAASSTASLEALLGKPRASEGPASPLATSFDTTLAGEFVVTVLDRNDGTISVAYRIRNPVVSFRVRGQEVSSEAAHIARDVSGDIFALLTSEGRVVSVLLDPRVGVLPGGIARATIARLQFVLPSGQQSSTKWETEEDDPNGRYLARYALTERRASGENNRTIATIRKAKVKYLKSPSPEGPRVQELPKEIRPAGALVGRFDLVRGHLIALNGTVSESIDINDKPVAQSTTTVRLDFLRRERLIENALAELRQARTAREATAKAVPLSWRPSGKASEEALQRQILGSATLDDLLAELRRADDTGVRPPGDFQLFSKLKALIALQPASSERLADIMTKAPVHSLTMYMVVATLSAVGHAEAQAAFVSAIRRRNADVEALTLLIPSLAQAPHPTELAEQTLRDLAFGTPNPQIASLAVLGLGTMAHSLFRVSPERADRIVASLTSRLEVAPDPNDARQLLLALGNAGSSRALPVLGRYVTDPSPELRRAAVGALRFIEDPAADAALVKALTKDRDGGVRLEAARGLARRPMTAETYSVQKRAFQTENEEIVRLALLDNLWAVRKRVPDADETVRRAAQSDRSAEVRKRAQALIASVH